MAVLPVECVGAGLTVLQGTIISLSIRQPLHGLGRPFYHWSCNCDSMGHGGIGLWH
jgi:hypothetical protein